MVKVTFESAAGERRTVEADVGDSVMMTALGNDVEGIVGECGGSMMCATCHCYVDEAWQEAVGPRVEGEEEMLEGAASEVRPGSRLGCQVILTAAMDGLVVHLPETQV